MTTPALSADAAAIVAEIRNLANWTGTGAKALAKLAAGGIVATGGTTGGSSSGGSVVVPPVTTGDPLAKFFTTDPGLALYPSPEHSRMVRNADGSISGRPYLQDSNGSVHLFVPVTSLDPTGYSPNGRHFGTANDPNFVVDSQAVYMTAIVLQGMVYVQRGGGQWQFFDGGRGSMYNWGLPAAWATDTNGLTVLSGGSSGAPATPVSTVQAPTAPTPMVPAPGASGKSLTVGTGKQYPTITAALNAMSAGDTILIDQGTYKETPPALGKGGKSFYLKGLGSGFVIDCTGLTGTLAYGKAACVPVADGILENGRITGVAMDQVGAQLTSAVRPDLGCGYLTLNNMELDGNQSGLGSGGDCNVKIVVNGGHFHRNGLNAGVDGNGYTHNIYTGALTSLTLNNLTSDDPNGGHPVKHRGYELIVKGGTFGGAMDAAVFDVPNGTVGQAVIDGATITKPAGAANHAIIDYATDGTQSGNGGLLLKNCTIDDECDNPFYLVGTGSVVTIDPSCKQIGNKATANGGGHVVGLAA